MSWLLDYPVLPKIVSMQIELSDLTTPPTFLFTLPLAIRNLAESFRDAFASAC
jgi:hypothetical protein